MTKGDLGKAPATRERIAVGALALFNVRGLGRVTTAEIAAAARIREGNLHYHFARKGLLIEALFVRFEVEALAIAGRRPTSPRDVSAYVVYQRDWFDLMWAYRCFYRDGAEMLDLSPKLRERVQGLRRRTQALARDIFEQAIASGLMLIEPETLTSLLDNIWIVSSYWMNYRALDIAFSGRDLAEADLEWGFAQIPKSDCALFRAAERARLTSRKGPAIRSPACEKADLQQARGHARAGEKRGTDRSRA